MNNGCQAEFDKQKMKDFLAKEKAKEQLVKFQEEEDRRRVESQRKRDDIEREDAIKKQNDELEKEMMRKRAANAAKKGGPPMASDLRTQAATNARTGQTNQRVNSRGAPRM